MSKRRAAVVVGAGVMGLSCAVELARSGAFEVTVLEAGYPGVGSSSRSVGVYTTQYLSPLDIELRVRGIERILELERDAGLTLRRIGYLRVGRDDAAIAAFERAVAIQRDLGVEDARVIDASELRRMVPDYAADGAVCALHGPGDGYIDGAELCATLAERAEALGAAIRVRAGLVGARRERGGGFVLATQRGELKADLVFNCAGAWAGRVGALLEAPVDVVNERHEAYAFELPRALGYTIPMVMDYLPGADAAGLYFRQEGERQLIAGVHSSDLLGAERVDDPNDSYEGTTQARVDEIVAAVDGAFPDLDGLAYRGGWAGLYPHSPDDRAVAGPHPDDPSVLVGAGLGGVGLSVGPALARLLAEWALDGEPRSVAGASALVPSPPC